MINDIISGAVDGVYAASIFYAGLLCFAYASIRLDEKSANWIKAVLLFVPIVSLYRAIYFVLPKLKEASSSYIIASAVAIAVGGYFIFLAFLDIYEREKK